MQNAPRKCKIDVGTVENDISQHLLRDFWKQLDLFTVSRFGISNLSYLLSENLVMVIWFLCPSFYVFCRFMGVNFFLLLYRP